MIEDEYDADDEAMFQFYQEEQRKEEEAIKRANAREDQKRRDIAALYGFDPNDYDFQDLEDAIDSDDPY